MIPAILYISYDGMLEPLGQSQVLGYLKLLADTRDIHLISYEKPDMWADVAERQRIAAEIASHGIRWHPLRYHKRPSALATAWDIFVGTAVGLYLVVRHKVHIVHARSYVSSVVALLLQRLTGARYLFDMRGFWADERVDGGLWRRDSWLYRTAKWFERQFLLRADHIVSLTHAAVGEMMKFPYLAGHMPPVTVIPTCTDLERFKPRQRSSREFVLGYVGSAGTWYEFDAVVESFLELRRHRPDARFLIINRNEQAYILERLAAACVPLDSVELRSARHKDVPLEIASMSAGVFFVRPLFSKQASAPTKLGEFLACGIPCLSNRGVGDMAALLEDNRVGVAVPDFTGPSIRAGILRLLELVELPGVQERCVEVARGHFALTAGANRYAQIYQTLVETV